MTSHCGSNTITSIDVLNKYFATASMPILCFTYPNMVQGYILAEAKKDLEVLQTIKNIDKQMTYVIKMMQNSIKQSIKTPISGITYHTHFNQIKFLF